MAAVSIWGPDRNDWQPVRREVRVEMVLRGAESRKVVDVWEIMWLHGVNGNSKNGLTIDGERALFPVRVDGGVYHLVRDWERSIVTIRSGPHRRLPMDESRPLWERVGLLGYWVVNQKDGYLVGHDPSGLINIWRLAKLDRGLVRHPNQAVRLNACHNLVVFGLGLDECWEQLSSDDRTHMRDGGRVCCVQADIDLERSRFAEFDQWSRGHGDRDIHRMLTTANHPKLRAEFCRKFAAEYPNDPDQGCPADRPPPATIVTEAGDVLPVGPWPVQSPANF